MIPHERSLVKKFEGRPFALVGVNSDGTSSPERLAAYKAKEKEAGVSWRSFRNESAKPAISKSWGVTGWPTLFYIDHQGVVRHKNIRDAEQMEQVLEEMIVKAEQAHVLEEGDSQGMEVVGLPPKAPYSIKAVLCRSQVIIELSLEDGWHAYSEQTDKGNPIRVSARDAGMLGELRFQGANGGILSGKARIVQKLNLDEEQTRVGMTLHLSVCDANGCLPPCEVKLLGILRNNEPADGDGSVRRSAPRTDLPKGSIKTSVGLNLIRVEAQSYWMGSPKTEEGHGRDEPRRQVEVTRPYWVGETEVTQGQWREVMGTAPWTDRLWTAVDEDIPATYVSWHDAIGFCEKLTAAERAAGRIPDGYRFALPTEAQWELACRASTTTPWSHGADEATLHKYAVFKESRRAGGASAEAVKGRAPNPWGFYDMHGNVEEWCKDAVSFDGAVKSDADRDAIDPCGNSGTQRVRRGGSYKRSVQSCRSAFRDSGDPGVSDWFCGFRVALVESAGSRK